MRQKRFTAVGTPLSGAAFADWAAPPVSESQAGIVVGGLLGSPAVEPRARQEAASVLFYPEDLSTFLGARADLEKASEPCAGSGHLEAMTAAQSPRAWAVGAGTPRTQCPEAWCPGMGAGSAGAQPASGPALAVTSGHASSSLCRPLAVQGVALPPQVTILSSSSGQEVTAPARAEPPPSQQRRPLKRAGAPM